MNREKKKYTIRIFDEEYVFLSDEAESLILQAAQVVDRTMREIQKSGMRDGKKIAVLSALRLTVLLEEQHKQLSLQQEKERALIARIDEELISSLV